MYRRLDRAAAGASRQTGMALIVSLLVLVVITLLTLSATQTSTLQENMAGNLRDGQMALQAAEAALRAGERQALASGGGVNRLEDVLGTDSDLSDWDGSSATGVYDMPDDAGLAADPVFHLGTIVPMRIGAELPPRYAEVVPVTARGVGGSPNSVVILRSNVYTTTQ